MNRIQINNTGIKVELSVFMFKEEGVHYAYCPELDLIGYDHSKDGARKSFEWVLKDYFDYTIKQGTLEQDLLKHGWRKAKTGNVTIPTPSSLLRRSQMKRILGKSEFSKYSIPVTL